MPKAINNTKTSNNIETSSALDTRGKIVLKFPTLEFIKSHPRYPSKDHENFAEYRWDIFEIPTAPAYCRITYNEDDNKKIFLDMIFGGYCDNWTPKGFNHAYPATIAGYKELQKVANEFVNEFMDKLLRSNIEYSEQWE